MQVIIVLCVIASFVIALDQALRNRRAARPLSRRVGRHELRSRHVPLDRRRHGRVRDRPQGRRRGDRPRQVRRRQLSLVSAYEPVPKARLREEARQTPADLQWMVNPREEVDATLSDAADIVREAGVRSRSSPARATPPTRSSTSPRSAART